MPGSLLVCCTLTFILLNKNMKHQLLPKSFLLLLLCCIATVSYGQFAQGSKTIGGGLGYRSEKQVNPSGSDRRNRNFYLNLSGGYLLEENLEVGANLGFSSYYSRTGNDYTADFQSSSSVFSLGPYVRVYNPVTDVVGLFGQAGFAAGFGGGTTGNTGTRVRTFEAGLRPGVILMVNENLGLETTIGFVGYNYYASGPQEDYADQRMTNNNFELRFDLSTIRFGLRLYLTD